MALLTLFPVLTMRLFADEKRTGTIEGLFTAPVTTSQVLLAKFFAVWLSYILLLTPIFLFFLLLNLFLPVGAGVHFGELCSALLGLILIGALNLALGTLASSLTNHQMIAAMVAFVFVMLHYFLGFMHQFSVVPDSSWTSALTHFSSSEHMKQLSAGLLDTRAILYYISFTALVLFLNFHVLEARKWRA